MFCDLCVFFLCVFGRPLENSSFTRMGAQFWRTPSANFRFCFCLFFPFAFALIVVFLLPETLISQKLTGHVFVVLYLRLFSVLMCLFLFLFFLMSCLFFLLLCAPHVFLCVFLNFPMVAPPGGNFLLIRNYFQVNLD